MFANVRSTPCAVLFVTCIVVGAMPRVLAGNDRLTRVVLPDEPTPAETHAANELIATISMMTGRTLSRAPESQNIDGGRALILGNTRSNLNKHNLAEWPRDTIFIGYGDSDVTIIGQGPQGTLFAVFEFLRDQGCRWYMPITYHKQEIGRYVPQRDRLRLNGPPKKHTPSFVDRGWHMTPVIPGPHYRDWAARNGVNAFTTGDTCIRYSPFLGLGYEKQTGHTLGWFVPSGALSQSERVRNGFAQHPEWYPLVNGKRTPGYRDGRAVQACLFNEEVVDQVANEVVRIALEGYENHRNPNWWLFSIGHNDEPTYWCECIGCRILDGPDSLWSNNDTYDAYPDDPMNRTNGPMSGRYTQFANRVARKVAAKGSDIMLSFYAYGSTVAPPRDRSLKLEDNVVVEFAYSGHCLKHDVDDPTCPTNVKLKSWIEDWTRRGKVLFYDYPPTGRHAHVPTGFIHHYQKLLKFLHSQGVLGLSGESQGVWAGSALFHYVKARLLWDIDTDVDQVIREFCSHQYGPAAETMLAYYQRYERGLAAHPGHMVWGSWIPTFDRQVLTDMQMLLDEAKRQTDDPLIRTRLKLVQVSLNTFVITQTRNMPAKAVTPAMFDHCRQLENETLKAIREMNLPYPMAATGPFIDSLTNSGYRPPFAALRGKEVLQLPVVWRFRVDAGDEGLKAGWSENPHPNGPAWQDLRTDDFWTNQGIAHHGTAWYQTTFVGPAKTDGQLWLLFPMLDGAAEIWIDGKLAGRTPASPWDKPKAVQCTDLIRAGRVHQLVLRVVKKSHAAGLNGRVTIMESVRRVGDQ